MAREEIIEKLDKFLLEHPLFDEDFYAVYLLVELRKLLETANDLDCLLLKFYCDWTVHPTKKWKLGAIQEIVDRINSCFSKESPYPSRTDEIFDFLSMIELKNEMHKLFKKHSLSTSFLERDSSWFSFVDSLTGVLSHQPILNPKDGIKSISLISVGKGRSSINIEFNDGRTDAMVGGER